MQTPGERARWLGVFTALACPGPGLSSQHSHGDAQRSVTPVQRALTPPFVQQRHCMHLVPIHTQNARVHKVKIHKLFKRDHPWKLKRCEEQIESTKMFAQPSGEVRQAATYQIPTSAAGSSWTGVPIKSDVAGRAELPELPS